MITKLNPPIRMTTEEAQEKYYPHSYVMINCEREQENGWIIAGEVVAYANARNNGGMLVKLQDELTDAGKCGEVTLELTKDPLDGGSLLIEYLRID